MMGLEQTQSRLLFQSTSHILSKSWLGASLTTILAWLSFLYFYFYTLLHAVVARRRGSSNTPLLQTLKHALTSPTKPVLLGVPTELAIGFVAGVASRAVSTPFSVVTVRLQTEDDDNDSDSDSEDEQSNASAPAPSKTQRTRAPNAGFFDVVRSIYADEGLAGFWAGAHFILVLRLESESNGSRTHSQASAQHSPYASPPRSRSSSSKCSAASASPGTGPHTPAQQRPAPPPSAPS